ncbi:MAG TPA: glycosyltransferase family 2 protein [Methylomirabilota bacterium]|nr:glycosyltransferase family 2 protein [Methylomirabilota bacterium]
MTRGGGATDPGVAVVIPTHGRPHGLRRCLESLARQDVPPAEVVVVDDGGMPPVDRAALPDLPGLVVVAQPHAGAGAARMTGVARTRAPILAFLDDDCSVPPDYVAAVARVFREHPATQVAQVRIVHPEPDNPYGRLWTFILDGLHRVNARPGPDGRLLSGTLGGVMIARRDVFTRVAYDPRLHVALEDADLRWQLHLAGIAVHWAPAVRVRHHVPRTLAGHLRQFVRYGRGAVHLARKWGATPPPFRACPLTGPRDLLDLVRREGIAGGVGLYGVLWMRRLALLAGSLWERVIPRRGRPRW